MEKILFVYNPHAGRGAVRGKLADIINALTRKGALCTALPTRAAGDARAAAASLAPEFGRVVVCGGDGTLHEVVNGLMELPPDARPPLGYIPAGTTNDFARSLALPTRLEEAAALAAEGEARGIDLGFADSQYFTYIAAFGAFTDVSYSTPQDQKNLLGHLAYLLKGISELSALKSYHLKISGGGREREGDYLYGMVTNTLSVGGLIGLPAETVSLDDGLLEGIFIRTPATLPEFQNIITALTKQEYTEESGVVALRGDRFVLENRDKAPLAFTMDGEFGGNYEKICLSAVKTPVKIVYGK